MPLFFNYQFTSLINITKNSSGLYIPSLPRTTPKIPPHDEGVYVITWNDVCRIKRCNKTDRQKILIIGQSSNLKNRFKTFIHAINNGTAKHSEGRLLFQSPLRLNINNMTFYYKLHSPSKMLEKQLIACYFNDFSEVPVFNSNKP